MGELRTADLDYVLPPERIAVTPAEPRDAARLLFTRRGRDGSVADAQHHIVRDLPTLLNPGDVLVFNTTRVVEARLEGARADTGGRVEGLYLRPGSNPSRWIVMLRGKRMKDGVRVALNASPSAHAPQGAPLDASHATGVALRLIHAIENEPGAWEVEVEERGTVLPHAGLDVLSRVGHVPLPPYILKARRDRDMHVDESRDRERYQTVYAHAPASGTDDASVAAPTAGLHFTPDLLAALAARGIERVDVTLEVGPGTFKPVETDTIQQHPMHRERCWMSAQAIERVLRARREGRRVIAVGTTSCRTLEACAREATPPASLETDILIAPGHTWRWVDGLLTNFHLPRSTLMALVGALLDDQRGVARLIELYEEAVRREYRFYSYGDAMLILP